MDVLDIKVIKRDGRIVPFDSKRIELAIEKAMISVGQYDHNKLEDIVKQVVSIIKESGKKEIHVEEIQDIIEYVLVKNNLYKIAKSYITYRKEKEKIRKEKIALLGSFYEEEVAKRFSLNAIKLMVDRYLLRNEEGELIEGPKQMFQRVAMLIVIPDILYDPRIYDKEGKQQIHPKEDFDPYQWEGKVGLGKREDGYEVYWNRYHLERMKYLYDELNSQGKMRMSWSEFWNMLLDGKFDRYYDNYLKYFKLMVEKKFLPNSPTLFNAGAKLGQLSACFVIDIDDDMESIMECAKEAAIIFKSGGGVGINYSKLRPEGDVVASTGGVASGPVSFMKIIDTVTDVIKQGGKRRGANMGILEIWHPDIFKFIHAKEKEGILENFNISVMITPDFWEYYEKDEKYPLKNPRNNEVWRYANPRKLLEEIAYLAWKTADPGVLFMDNINRRNVQKETRGYIRATNPCGEQPLYPYESCNLGSINLYAFIKRKNGEVYFDWDEYKETIKWAYRFLDNVIDVNKYPIEKIEKASKAVRRIGLGFMGLADALYALKIPYNSEEGFAFISKVSEWLTYYAMEESVNRAKERGVFPLYEKTSYVKGEMPVEGYYHKELWTLDWESLKKKIMENGIRNVEVTSIAPTGSISMFYDISSGIEPQYALVYEKRVTAGTFYYIDIEFERQLKENGLYKEELLEKIAKNGGSIQGIEEIPEDMRRIFVTALDIPWWDHVRAQAVAQLWITTSISKTINMPEWVDPEDVLKAYLFAYKSGCKGITVYREGSKSRQVYYAPTEESKKRITEVLRMIKEGKIENKTLSIMKTLGIDPPKWYGELLNNHTKIPKIKLEVRLPKKPIEVAENNHITEKCPVCGSTNLIHQGGCVFCANCGWSECIIA